MGMPRISLRNATLPIYSVPHECITRLLAVQLLAVVARGHGQQARNRRKGWPDGGEVLEELLGTPRTTSTLLCPSSLEAVDYTAQQPPPFSSGTASLDHYPPMRRPCVGACQGHIALSLCRLFTAVTTVTLQPTANPNRGAGNLECKPIPSSRACRLPRVAHVRFQCTRRWGDMDMSCRTVKLSMRRGAFGKCPGFPVQQRGRAATNGAPEESLPRRSTSQLPLALSKAVWRLCGAMLPPSGQCAHTPPCFTSVRLLNATLGYA
eukprot:6331922-Alexandrium_andersonii.AAC.1